MPDPTKPYVPPPNLFPVARPEELPTPPVTYSPSKPAVAFGELAKSFIPQANQEDIRRRLTVMAGPGAGYGNFLGEAARTAGAVLGDIKTLRTEPISGQEWWNSAFRTGALAAGAGRMFAGGSFGDPYAGTRPVGARFFMKKLPPPELPPATEPSTYTLQPRPTFREYHEAYKQAAAAGDDAGARNIVSMAYKEGKPLPVSNPDHYTPEMMRHVFEQQYGLPRLQ